MPEQETNSASNAEAKKNRKRTRRIRYWVLAELAVLAIILFLFLHRPCSYNPPGPVNNGTVSTYLTHELLADFYNNVQLDKPFDLIVEQDGIADIIAHKNWPWQCEGFTFDSLLITFEPGKIVLMCTVRPKGVRVVVTVVLVPSIDENGLLHLQVEAIKIGLVNITYFARILAERMYAKRLAKGGIDSDDWRAKIAAALLGNKPVEPVFDIEAKKVRIKKIRILKGRLIIGFIPAEYS